MTISIRHCQDEDRVPLEDYQRLDVAIVGAGIAGLGAAIGLSRNGHNVEVKLFLN
jgi:monoamine oxidase